MNPVFHVSEELKKEIIENRRILHQNAEVGFELPKTRAFVLAKLREYGYEPAELGGGVVCMAGSAPGPVFLLRADMDALPMREESGLPYACPTGNCHSCGHDTHTAMLLGAARLLKEHEAKLKGRVKLMFQPAEELLSGAAAMVEAGILEHPRVNAAMGLHVLVGRETSKTGTIHYCRGTVNRSGDAVRITVTGKDAHGSTPHLGIDAISVAARIVLALEELAAKEIPPYEDSVVLVGTIEGGTTCNTVAGSAVLEVSVRTPGHRQREFLKRRIKEIAEGIASVYRAEAAVDYLYGMPPLVNHDAVLDCCLDSIRELLPPGCLFEEGNEGGSEDFTVVAERVPSAFLMVGAGDTKSGYEYSMHHPAMRLDENALAIGTEIYVNCAVRFLELHSQTDSVLAVSGLT